MRIFGLSDAAKLLRVEAEQGATFLELLHNRLFQDTNTTFREAHEMFTKEKRPAALMTKVGGVGLGAVIMADGIFHIVAGANERVDDLFLHTHKNYNYTRIFAGVTELGLGAVVAYMAATLGPRRPSI